MVSSIEREIYDDVQILRKMKTPDEIKIKMLGCLLIRFEDIWRVIGITEDALKIFAANDFKKVSGMQINRSHLKDRAQTYPNLINLDLSIEEWWQLLRENNDCILATSSENMSNKWSRVIEIDTSLGLFKSSGFAWKHSVKNEATYLRGLFDKHLVL